MPVGRERPMLVNRGCLRTKPSLDASNEGMCPNPLLDKVCSTGNKMHTWLTRHNTPRLGAVSDFGISRHRLATLVFHAVVLAFVLHSLLLNDWQSLECRGFKQEQQKTSMENATTWTSTTLDSLQSCQRLWTFWELSWAQVKWEQRLEDRHLFLQSSSAVMGSSSMTFPWKVSETQQMLSLIRTISIECSAGKLEPGKDPHTPQVTKMDLRCKLSAKIESKSLAMDSAGLMEMVPSGWISKTAWDPTKPIPQMLSKDAVGCLVLEEPEPQSASTSHATWKEVGLRPPTDSSYPTGILGFIGGTSSPTTTSK